MSKRILIVLVAVMIGVFVPVAAAEDFSVQDVFDRMVAAQERLVDISFIFVIIRSGQGELEKFYQALEQESGRSVPRDIYTLVWIKRPDMMKTYSGEGTVMITKKEGNELIKYIHITGRDAYEKQELFMEAWPVWPDQLAVLNMLKIKRGLASRQSLEQIDRPDGIHYLLSIEFDQPNRQENYYIRSSDWMMIRSVIIENGAIAQTLEWRDIIINANLQDDLFELNLEDPP